MAASNSSAPVDTTSALMLTALGGSVLELTRRALPYLPLSLTGKQRAEFTWYPGSPQATVQMLGPEEDAITINGYWKDRFIAGSGDAKIDNAAVSDVATLVQAVDTMRRQGRQITLAWAGLSRIGHITSFTQTWHNTHDVEWELEFSVLAQESTTVSAGSAPSLNQAGIAASAVAEADAFANSVFGRKREAVQQGTEDLVGRGAQFGVAGDAVLNPLQQLNAALEEADTQVTAFASTLAGYAQAATALITTPTETARSIIATCSSTITQITNAAGTLVDSSLTEWYSITSPNGIDGVPFGLQVGGRSYQRQVGNAIKSVVSFCAVTRYEVARQVQGETQQTYQAVVDIDLRDVSTMFYKTPNQWRYLMTQNELLTSRLQTGQVIIIPQLPWGEAI